MLLGVAFVMVFSHSKRKMSKAGPSFKGLHPPPRKTSPELDKDILTVLPQLSQIARCCTTNWNSS